MILLKCRSSPVTSLLKVLQCVPNHTQNKSEACHNLESQGLSHVASPETSSPHPPPPHSHWLLFSFPHNFCYSSGMFFFYVAPSDTLRRCHLLGQELPQPPGQSHILPAPWLLGSSSEHLAQIFVIQREEALQGQRLRLSCPPAH